MAYIQKEKPIVLGKPLRDWQKDCCKTTSQFMVLPVHRRAGKTEMSLLKLVNGWTNCKHDDGYFSYICPELSQSIRVAWRRLKTLIRPLIKAGMVKINESEKWIEYLGSNHRPVIQLLGAENAESIRGVHFDGLIVDEVANIKKEVWEEVIYPTLIDEGQEGWVIFIGTPAGQNLFYELWLKTQTGDPRWSGKLYTVYETGVFSKAKIEQIRKDIGEKTFAQEFLCDFNVAAENQLISMVTVQEALDRDISYFDLIDVPLVVGVDVARFGKDSSVLYPRRGLQAFKPQVFHNMNNMDLASRIANYINIEDPQAVFIDGGAGAGVIDRLRQLGFDQVVEVQFGSRANDDQHYKNRRIEMYCNAKEWLDLGGALKDKNTANQLTIPRYKYDPVGKLMLESKEDIRKRVGFSPDLSDAFCLTFAAPVINYRRNDSYKTNNTDYDPFSQYEKECAHHYEELLQNRRLRNDYSSQRPDYYGTTQF